MWACYVLSVCSNSCVWPHHGTPDCLNRSQHSRQRDSCCYNQLECARSRAHSYAQAVCCLLLPRLQEEENLSLVAQNAELQERLAAAQAARAAAAAQTDAAGSPRTPASNPASTPASQQWVNGVQARAAVALQRAADTSRLSGAFEVSVHTRADVADYVGLAARAER